MPVLILSTMVYIEHLFKQLKEVDIVMTDYLIIGCGIMGLTIARELKKRAPHAKITMIEKEATIGCHASGRNSGVMHTGIYYPKDSLKAKLCSSGAKAMRDFCDEHQLPINRCGKVVIPLKTDDDKQLDLLLARARANQATATIIDEKELKDLEPNAYSVTGKALYAKESAVIDSKAVLKKLADLLRAQQVQIRFKSQITALDTKQKSITVNGEKIRYGFLFNTAGMYADVIAKQFDLAKQYKILPFKGIYYRLNPTSDILIKRLIYPVPDLNVPFLGVHFTTSTDGTVYVGPTAVPAFGREHYKGCQGIDFNDALNVFYYLSKLYIKNKQGFRQFTHQEALRFFKSRFVSAAKGLVPKLQKEDLLLSSKVGIRSQLLDIEKDSLIMDFLVEKRNDSAHILNAVSPAFTSSFAFSQHILNTLTI